MYCIRVFLLFAATMAAVGYAADDTRHWSLQALSRPQIPPVDAAVADRVRTPVDAFILDRLRKNGIEPSSVADRRTLIRRLYLDVTGFPPPADVVEEFLKDDSPAAYERRVDSVLASPQYGERWGQHWLDVVRFAESEGFEYDRHRAGAWRFRDYVIQSLNSDKPFDHFVVEQIAGDELPAADDAARYDLQVAAGFHRLGPIRRNAGNPEVAFSRNEVLTEMTNIIGTAFLGLTLGCARCHDHMFDPISQRDYYEIQAFLAATHEHDVPLASADEQARWKKHSDEIQAEIEKLKMALAAAAGVEEQRLREKLQEAEYRLPAPLPTISTVRNENDKRSVIHLLDRGDPERTRARVAPQFLDVLLPPGTNKFDADLEQPKSVLARWIADAHNPLTARVIVNRLWQYHFGRGIVVTANDFGVNGARPSHPELLDYLATELVRNGWRLKPLHRMILLSGTYRQSSGPVDSAAADRDPDNELLWRQNRRRLDAAQIRDAMLAVSGVLNREAGGPSVMVPVERELIDLLYKPTQWEVAPKRGDHQRRSVYLIAKRNLKLPFMEVFDQPDLQTSCPRREASTHAPQALELLNGPLSNELARRFAARLEREAGDDAERQIELAFALAVSRPPTPAERKLSLEFLDAHPLSEFALAMFNLNAFLYVD